METIRAYIEKDKDGIYYITLDDRTGNHKFSGAGNTREKAIEDFEREFTKATKTYVQELKEEALYSSDWCPHYVPEEFAFEIKYFENRETHQITI